MYYVDKPPEELGLAVPWQSGDRPLLGWMSHTQLPTARFSHLLLSGNGLGDDGVNEEAERRFTGFSNGRLAGQSTRSA